MHLFLWLFGVNRHKYIGLQRHMFILLLLGDQKSEPCFLG